MIIPIFLVFKILFTEVVGKGNKVAGAKIPKLKIVYNMAMKCFTFSVFACNRDFLPEFSVELV